MTFAISRPWKNFPVPSGVAGAVVYSTFGGASTMATAGASAVTGGSGCGRNQAQPATAATQASTRRNAIRDMMWTFVRSPRKGHLQVSESRIAGGGETSVRWEPQWNFLPN